MDQILFILLPVRDSDSPPVMQFTNSTMSVDESDGSITIPLTLTHDGSTKQASDVGDATNDLDD